MQFELYEIALVRRLRTEIRVGSERCLGNPIRIDGRPWPVIRIEAPTQRWAVARLVCVPADHDASSTTSLSRSRALESRDFTVPGGTPRTSAVSPSERSSR